MGPAPLVADEHKWANEFINKGFWKSVGHEPAPSLTAGTVAGHLRVHLVAAACASREGLR
jgi:hypothetical protein